MHYTIQDNEISQLHILFRQIKILTVTIANEYFHHNIEYFILFSFYRAFVSLRHTQRCLVIALQNKA